MVCLFRFFFFLDKNLLFFKQHKLQSKPKINSFVFGSLMWILWTFFCCWKMNTQKKVKQIIGKKTKQNFSQPNIGGLGEIFFVLWEEGILSKNQKKNKNLFSLCSLIDYGEMCAKTYHLLVDRVSFDFD